MKYPHLIEVTLAEKYPNIDTTKYIWQQLIEHHGYAVGWNDLIIELIKAIEKIYEKHNNLDIHDFCIDGTKEKYGGLRVDARSSLMEVHELISEYENKSKEVCEECGEVGRLRDGNWVEILCDACYGKNKEVEKK